MNDLGLFVCQRGSGVLLWRAGRDLGVALMCISLGLAAAAPKSAHACTTLRPPAVLVGYPADGQVEVPTDVVPFYSVFDAHIEGVATAQFKLTSSEGAVIAVQPKLSHVWHADLLPSQLLEPNTKYRVELSLPSGESVSGISFTTGAGPFEGTPPPPSASLQHYQFAPSVPLTSCSPPRTGTCVALTADWPTEVTHLWNGNVDPTYVYLYEGSFFTNLSGLEQGTPFDCVSLRSRAPNGVYSTPVELCRDDGPLLTLSDTDPITCTADGLLQEPAQARTPNEAEDPPSDADVDGADGANESASCSLRAPGGSGEWHLFAISFAAVAWRQSKRRRRSDNGTPDAADARGTLRGRHEG
ncbi:MAG TPA: Ig-like domain-containing protein [Polyangiaceae bacterium]|nr:Ig-like domain-containing protein [Polyangiaceae bacterium]